MPLIVIAEPELDVVQPIEEALTDARFVVRRARTGAEALEEVERDPTSLLLLSIDLPDVRGAEVLRRIRRTQHLSLVPVVARSNENHEVDRVVALELGADDFVGGHVSPRELVLRIKAVLRRSRRPRRTSRTTRHGGLVIDHLARTARVNERDLPLTRTEGALLTTLASQRRVWPRDELIRAVWPESEVDHRTVDTFVHRLREKLAGCGALIETVRGLGYRLRVESVSAQSERA